MLRSFEVEETRRDRKACIRPMVLQRHIPKVPLVGVYLSLSIRGLLAVSIET
jgi:hypothetical protein